MHTLHIKYATKHLFILTTLFFCLYVYQSVYQCNRVKNDKEHLSFIKLLLKQKTKLVH